MYLCMSAHAHMHIIAERETEKIRTHKEHYLPLI